MTRWNGKKNYKSLRWFLPCTLKSNFWETCYWIFGKRWCPNTTRCIGSFEEVDTWIPKQIPMLLVYYSFWKALEPLTLWARSNFDIRNTRSINIKSTTKEHTIPKLIPNVDKNAWLVKNDIVNHASFGKKSLHNWDFSPYVVWSWIL
jgi:hypothetical protein